MPMIAPNTPESLYQRHQFALEINGFDVALFSKVKLPEIELNEVEFNPAGSMFPQKVAGRAKFADITCEKGVLQNGTDRESLNWLALVLEANSGVGMDPQVYMRDVDIVQYTREGVETRRWHLHGAWPKKLEYGEAEGGSDENVIEILTICYQFYNVV